MEFYLQLVISGLVLGSIYALVALGFAIIFKSTSVVNFAQGELMMFGAYFCFSMVVQYKVPWIWAFLITILFSIALALVVERLILRPMIGEPVISIIMVTIGLSSVLRSIVTAIWGTQIQVYDPPLFPEATVNLVGVPTSQVYLWSFGLSAVLLALFAVFFKYSKAGVAMRATAFSNQVALSMGIPVKNIFALAWCIASVVSAIGGHPDRQHQRHQRPAWPLRPEGLPGGHPGRPGLHTRSRHRRAHRGRPGEPLGWRPEDHLRPLGHQGSRALRLPRHHPDDQALRPLRQEGDRADMRTETPMTDRIEP